MEEAKKQELKRCRDTMSEVALRLATLSARSKKIMDAYHAALELDDAEAFKTTNPLPDEVRLIGEAIVELGAFLDGPQ